MSASATAGRQISLLAICQALLYVNNVTLISINGLAGLALSPTPLFATLPITAYIVGSALTTVPASLAMARWGRRNGFMFGSGMAIVGTSTAALGMLAGSFVLLCLGTFCTGIYNAFAQYLRFAAADVADAYDPALKERAISWVLAGGIAGGLIGPELSKLTVNLLSTAFAASYFVLAAVALLAGMVASRLVIPQHVVSATAAPARPLAHIARQPTFIVAVAVGAISYGTMNLLMTATPLAMQVCGFGYPAAADVIKWHVVGMFAPGFFAGHLIRRFGVLKIMLIGCVLMFLTVGIAHAGLTYWHFWFALFALGIGWNFMFVAATTLLTTTYTTAEKAKVQGVNDLAVFVTMISSSAASGALVSTSGWTDLNLYAVPALVVATLGAAYLMSRPASRRLKAT
ncbi:MAG TPA: MFS transporter [Burkholderiaceae bacterium]|nr:MFS transporter [Burkholderiaceae bacterium]